MTYEQYRMMFLIFAILSAIFFLTAVFLLIYFKIPKIIGDFTGANARKAIQNIRMQNEKSGDKRYKVSAVNRERGKITDKISPSGNLVERPQEAFSTGVITEKIDTSEGEMTEVLRQEEREKIFTYSDETVLLSEPTSLGTEFYVEKEIYFLHTDEFID